MRVLEILESPGILFWHFPGLESPGKCMQVLKCPGQLMQVLESPGNLCSKNFFLNNFLQYYFWISIL